MIKQKIKRERIGWTAAWPGHLPAKHRELVTQDQELDLVRSV